MGFLGPGDIPARTLPCASAITLMRSMMRPTLIANHAGGQGHGTSYAYGGIQSGDDIYIIGRACASPSHT